MALNRMISRASFRVGTGEGIPQICKSEVPKVATVVRIPRAGLHSSAGLTAQNRIYDSIRNEESLNTLLNTSLASNIPLITFWTASWCPTCRFVSPILKEIIENKDGMQLSKDVKVGYVEVEVDAPDVGMGRADLPMRYSIRSIPTLLVFRRSLAQTDKILSSSRDLRSRERLRAWIEDISKDTEHDRKSSGSRWGGLAGFWSS